MYERALEERSRKALFLAHLDQIWGKAFVASETLYSMAIESAQQYGDYIDSLDPELKIELRDKEYRFIALSEIQGRACQQYLEILCLLKAGLADGAFARWRSIYELSVIAEFISKSEEAVAKAFIDAADSEQYSNEWARVSLCFLNKGKISFRDLQNQCSYVTDTWIKEYKLACYIVHASPQGTLKRISNYGVIGSIAAGRSDYGLPPAGINSAISLSIITNIFLNLYTYADGLANGKNMVQWIDIIRKYYSDAEECFEDEAALSE